MTRRIACVALFLTCVVPLLGGIYIGTTLVLEGQWMPALEPDRVDRLPLFVHVVGATTYYVLAAVQFLPGVRRRHPRWHRRAGRVAIAAGIASALACTWLTLAHPGISGPILHATRVVFGPLWTLFLVLGLRSILRGDVGGHRDWMIRAFAVAMPAGTLVFVFAPFFLVLGELTPILEESIQSCTMFVHLGVAEWLIRRRRVATSTQHLRSLPA